MDAMKSARKSSRNKAPRGVPLTEEKFKYYFERIKELIVSTAKGTEAKLGKKIDAVEVRVGRTEMAITEHSRMIRNLDTKVDLVRVELKSDMVQMEHRLSEKIDGGTKRLDDHESRIKALERVA
jgi:hypothetical protein